VQPVSGGDVRDQGGRAFFNGTLYPRQESAVSAVVTYVQGEFYWRVEIGETVEATDYRRPPQVLSKEVSGSEVNWSLGTYVPKEEIERKFKVQGLPSPTSPSPLQPLSSAGSTVSCLVIFVVVMVIVLVILMCGVSGVITGGGRSPGGSGTSGGGYGGGK
jgi:hypothetical protein